MPSPFPCSPVIHEWLWKKTQIEKKILQIIAISQLQNLETLTKESNLYHRGDTKCITSNKNFIYKFGRLFMKESQLYHSSDIKLGINKIKNSVSKGNFSEVE